MSLERPGNGPELRVARSRWTQHATLAGAGATADATASATTGLKAAAIAALRRNRERNRGCNGPRTERNSSTLKCPPELRSVALPAEPSPIADERANERTRDANRWHRLVERIIERGADIGISWPEAAGLFDQAAREAIRHAPESKLPARAREAELTIRDTRARLVRWQEEHEARERLRAASEHVGEAYAGGLVQCVACRHFTPRATSPAFGACGRGVPSSGATALHFATHRHPCGSLAEVSR